MDRRAQGAFEYILLLAGVLLIVILVVVILRTSVLGQANQQIRQNVNAYLGLTNCTQFTNASGAFVNCTGQVLQVANAT